MEIKNLNEVCMINMGQSPDSSSYNDKKEGLAFYQGNADFGEIHPTTRVWCNNPIKIAEKDDILISVRAPIGSMNIANEKCCIGRGLASIKPIDKNECNQNYLYYFLESKVPYMQSKGTGSTFKAINKGILTSLQIKLPNIREQEKISSIISKIKAQIHNKKLQIRKYDELVKSQFIEMFGDVNTNPKHWEMTKLQNICSSIVRGPFGSALKKEFFVEKNDTTYKVYEQKNAIQKSEKLGTYYITKEKYEELKRFECKPNDFIMSCSGTMGELYQLPASSEKGIINQALCKFTLNGKMNSIVFLEFMKDAIRNIETKGSGIQNIASVIYIKNLDVYVPPIELQNQFADFVKHIDKLKFTIKQSIEKLELCYKSLMKQYFD